jgi:hypothetical protein
MPISVHHPRAYRPNNVCEHKRKKQADAGADDVWIQYRIRLPYTLFVQAESHNLGYTQYVHSKQAAIILGW